MSITIHLIKSFTMKGILFFSWASLASLLVSAQPLNVSWTALGGGTNQKVQTLLRLSNGDLLVAGQFIMAGTTECRRIARWDGVSYTAMPGFPEQFEISSAAELNDTIYVGGGATSVGSNPPPDLMKWDGSAWTGRSVFGYSFPGGIKDLFVHDGQLYASGSWNTVSNFHYGVKRVNATAWQGGVGQPLNGEVRSMGYFNGHLICAGDFTGAAFGDHNGIQHVAYLEGETWIQLGDGLNGRVNDLLVSGNTLFATGDMRSPTENYFGLARITPEASAWEQLMPNMANYMLTPWAGTDAGHALVEYAGGLYIGGEFTIAGDVPSRGLAVFHGAPDAVEAFCHFQGPVQALALFNGHELVVGGNSNTYRNLASTDLLTVGVGNGTERSPLMLWPNPASSAVNVRLGGSMASGAQLRVLDMHGRLVRRMYAGQGSDLSINLSGEPAGTYLIEILREGQVHRERLVLMP